MFSQQPRPVPSRKQKIQWEKKLYEQFIAPKEAKKPKS